MSIAAKMAKLTYPIAIRCRTKNSIFLLYNFFLIVPQDKFFNAIKTANTFTEEENKK